MGSQLRWTSTASSAYGGGDQWDFAIHNQLISSTTEVLLEQCQGTVCETIVTSLDTSILVPSFSEDSTDLAAPPTTSPPAATAASATAGEFSVDCSFDSGLRRIWCEASRDSNSAQITWGAGSQWGAAGRTFEYLLTEDWQLIPETLVTVENCEGSNCLTVEIAVDTSSVALSPAKIESLTCTDQQITAGRETTCRAAVSGEVDFVAWYFDGEMRITWQKLDTETSLEHTLVQ